MTKGSMVSRDCRKWYILVLMSFLLISLSDSSSGPSTLIGIVGRDYVLLGADTTHSGNGGIAVTSSDIDKIYKISDGPTHPMLAAVAGDLANVQRFVHSLKAQAMIREYQDGIGNDVNYVYLNDDEFKEDLGSNVANMAELARTQILPSCCMLLGGIVSKNDKNGERNTARFLHQLNQQRNLQAQIKAAELDYQLNYEKSIDDQRIERKIDENHKEKEYHPQLYWLDETQCLIPQCDYSAHGYGSNFVLSILDRKYNPNLSLEEAVQLLNNCFQQLSQRYVLNSPKPHTMKCIQKDPVSGSYIIRSLKTS